jgi:hypothetical protein
MVMGGMSTDEFVHTIESKHIGGSGLSHLIRSALNDLLGEISATASLAYVGDAQNGDIRGFATRADELFGSSAPMVFSHIVGMADKNVITERTE